MFKALISSIAVMILCLAGTGYRKANDSPEKQKLINVHISNNRSPDMHDINTIISSITRPGMTDEEKVLSVFHLLNRYGYEAVYPTDGNSFGWRTCGSDPVKFLNMYPWGECGTYQNLTCELLVSMGFPARRIQIQDHWIPEAWYNNAWHYIDPRWGMVFYKRDGKTIASVKDLYEDTTLMTRPVRKEMLVYQRDSKELKSWAKMYSFWKILPNSKSDTSTGYSTRGEYHRMNIDLVPGDEYILSTEKEGEKGYWYCPDDLSERFLSDASRRNHKTVEIPGNGPKPVTDSKVSSQWTYPGFSNSKLIYAPDLTSGKYPGRVSSEVNTEFSSSEPYIHPQKAGKAASVIFNISSPYIIVNGTVDAKIICRNQGDSCSLSVSSDKGRSWLKVTQGSNGKFDITKGIYGSYDYSLKISFFAKGNPSDAGISSIKITSIFQSSPVSVPLLVPGSNIIKFRVDNPEIIKTIKPVVEYCWSEKDSVSGKRIDRTRRQVISPEKTEYEIKCGRETVTRYVKMIIP